MARWGSTWGSLWGRPIAVPNGNLNNIRNRSFVHVAYLLVIEGLPYMWVTDHSDSRELEGSGASSWIGAYESAASLPYTRQVLGGLKMPSRFKCQPTLDINTGMFRTNIVSFELVDHDGILPQLFAQEGKTAYRLGQRIAPGTANNTSVTTRTTSFTTASAEWIAEGACYVDTETLGPSGQRRWWPCMPDQDDGGFGVTWVGMEHAAWADPNNGDNQEEPIAGPPRVRVSFDPLVFEGRKCALYRIYKDTDIDADVYTAWPHWGDQHTSGNLVWWGTLRDSGEISGGGDSWKLSCFGQESWLKSNLGTKRHDQWLTVSSANFELSDERRKIAVEFFRHDYENVGTGREVYDSSSFVYNVASSYTNPDDLVEDIRNVVHAIRDGGSGGTLPDYPPGASDFDTEGHDFEFERNAVRIRIGGSNNIAQSAHCRIALHESAWRYIGWDPDYQSTGKQGTFGTDEYRVEVRRLSAGERFSVDATNASPAAIDAYAPSDGYLVFDFNTQSRDQEEYANNDNEWKAYKPIHEGSDIVILGHEDSLSFSVSEDSIYIPDDPLAPLGSADVTPGNQQEESCFMLFRGKRIEGNPSQGEVLDDNGNVLDDVEVSPFYQFAIVGWENGGVFGSVSTAGNDRPTFRVARWLNPRSIGYDFSKLAGNAEWAALSTGDLAIQCLPINAYAYNWSLDSEAAWTLLPQLLLSTGTAYNTGSIPNPIFAVGANNVAGGNPVTWAAADDRASADMGLGIPNELVATNADIYSQFDGVQSQTSGFNLVRYAYGPAYESYKMIQSLIQPRGMHLTLREGRYGVQKWEFNPEDVEATIEESDLRGTPGVPSSVRPSQTMRATGQIDGVELSARKMVDDVDSEYSLARVYSQKAKDPSAHLRPGDKIVPIEEHGFQNDGEWRTFWAYEIPEFFSKRHFMVSNLKVSRELGQDLYIGSRIRLSNPWIVDTAGNRGITGAFGIVVGVTLDHRNEVYILDVLVYAGQFGDGPRVFMPIGRISSTDDASGTTIALDADFLDHDEGADAAGFDAPTWSAGGAVTVQIMSFDRNSWEIHSPTAVVSSVSGNNVTVASAFSSVPNEYRERYLVAVGYDSQAASSWPLSYGLVTGKSDGEFGSGPTTNTKYSDKE